MKLAWATALLLLGSTGVSSLTIPSESSALVEGNDARRSGSSGGSSGGHSSSSSNRGGSSRGSGTQASYGGGRYDSTTHNVFHSYNSYDSYGGRYHSSDWPWMVPQTYTSGSSRTIETLQYPKTKTKTKTHDRYYAGGARTPYTAGSRSPRGITPFILPVAALAFFPGIWLYGAYAYPYHNPYYYEDEHSHRNESMRVVCVCQEYQECGCDDNNNSTYYESLFNGTQPRNTSNTRVVNVNGTEKIYINGTLANGTTAADGSSSGALTSVQTLLHVSGYWVTAALVATAVWVF